MLYAFQLGRLPSFGLAEIVSLFPNVKIVIQNNEWVICDMEGIVDPQKILDRCGGIIRMCEVKRTNEDTVVSETETLLFNTASSTEGKLIFGISQFGNIGNGKLLQRGLTLKKALKQNGRHARFIDPQGKNISTASVIHNKLLTDGVELIELEVSGSFFTGRTVAIQNIENYTKRDMGKPARDLGRGMLPPKLAQVMVNCAQIPAAVGGTVLDPFCGSGTILMEALLNGNAAYGSDNDPAAIRASEQNVAWITNTMLSTNTISEIRLCDARKLSACWDNRFNAIVTEGSLGPLLTHAPAFHQIEQIQGDLLDLYRGFFPEAAAVLVQNGKLVLSTPIFRLRSEHVRIHQDTLLRTIGPLWQLDPILEHSPTLLYERPDQFVGREIWRFIKA